MKILIISDAWHPQINGVVRTYEHLAAELEKKGHEVRVTGPSDYPFSIACPGYSEIRLAFFTSKKLKSLIDTFKPDTIHIGTEGPLGRAARKICLKQGYPFTTCYHTQFPEYIAKRAAKFLPFLYKPVRNIAAKSLRKFHKPSASMIVATKGLESALREDGYDHKIDIMTRGVNLDLFKPAAASLFKDMPKPVALYVGRVAIEKNLEDFLQMNWTGSKVVVGDGPSKASFQSEYKNIHFAGSQTGEVLAAHYQSADVFVFPSRTDTFGMVLTEALACGIPVAAYDVTGPKDIITDEKLGYLTNDNLSAAAQKCLSLTAHEKARVHHVIENFTWDVAAKQFLDISRRAIINQTQDQ